MEIKRIGNYYSQQRVDMKQKYVVLIWEGKTLFAVTGPFISRDLAREFISIRNNPSESYDIVPLWNPKEVEKE